MVSYSPRAAKALSYLKRPFNDIDIYVEDTGNHNMWLLMLRRILPARIRLASVNLLGGRSKVLEACRLDQADNGRRKLYVIDGDFDFLHKKAKPRLKHLYRLRAYCVENLLIEEDAIVKSVMPYEPKLTEEQIALRFNYKSWYPEFEKYFTSLFVMYAVVNKLKPSVQTVGFNVQGLIDSTANGPIISKPKILRRIRHLINSLRPEFSILEISAHRKATADILSQCRIEQCISGKDYIIPIIWLRMKSAFQFRGTFEQLKCILAQQWRPEREAFFRRRVLSLLAH